MKRGFVAAWFAALAVLWPVFAQAHEMSMAEMELREVSHGEFIWQWSAVSDKRPSTDDLKPVWPEACKPDLNVLHCGDAGLSGTLAVQGVGQRYSAALVRVFWLDGQSRVYTITAAQPKIQLYGAADDKRGGGQIMKAYVVLGVEHILGGIDHLLFVICLLFLVGFNKRLLWTITAFTAAHSLTLILSALGLLSLRGPPVEAVIALSIVLMASEAIGQQDTLTRRAPAVVAFVFGLVHGLGFAGALRDIGLPENHLLLALLTFNVGVEIGQLMTVAAAFALARSLRSQPWSARLSKPVLYGIGSIAAYWSIARIALVLS